MAKVVKSASNPYNQNKNFHCRNFLVNADGTYDVIRFFLVSCKFGDDSKVPQRRMHLN